MRWVIEGADALSGRDVRVEVQAPDQLGAQLEAKKRRILVANITEMPLQPLEQFTLDPDVMVDLSPSSPAPPLSCVQPPPEDVPPYLGLTGASFVLGVFALLYYIGGLFAVLASIVRTSERSADAFYIGVIGLGCIAAGGLFHGGAAGCVALRDIAQNSHRTVARLSR